MSIFSPFNWKNFIFKQVLNWKTKKKKRKQTNFTLKIKDIPNTQIKKLYTLFHYEETKQRNYMK